MWSQPSHPLDQCTHSYLFPSTVRTITHPCQSRPDSPSPPQLGHPHPSPSLLLQMSKHSREVRQLLLPASITHTLQEGQVHHPRVVSLHVNSPINSLQWLPMTQRIRRCSLVQHPRPPNPPPSLLPNEAHTHSSPPRNLHFSPEPPSSHHSSRLPLF